MKKIVITGGSVNGNSGAEAMLVTVIKRLNEVISGCEFGIYTPYYKDDKILFDGNIQKHIRLYNYSPLRLLFIFPVSMLAGFFKILRFNKIKKIFPKAVQFIWEADVLIDVAGVSFIDERIKFLPYNILTIYPAFLLKVPVVKIAQAVGPFNKFINRFFAKHCFRKINHTFARGEKTLEHLNQLNISSKKYSLASDIAFINKTGDSITKENHAINELLNTLKLNNNKTLIGICPSTVVEALANKRNYDYKKFLVDLCSNLIDNNYLPIIFPNATKEHKQYNRRNNDIPLINDIVNELSLKKSIDQFIVYNKNLNTDGVKAIISKLDVCLVSRFHAMVFSLSLLKPVCVLGWSHKYLEVMDQFGLGSYVFDYRSKSIDETVNIIRKLYLKKDDIKDQIVRKIDDVMMKANSQIVYIKTILDS